MRDFITVTALLVSLSGIAVSLAREEVRCYIGLNAEPCQVQQPESPDSNRQEASSVGRDSDRKSSDIIPNSTEPSTSSVEKSLNKNDPDNLPPTSQDATVVPETPTTQPLTAPETSPAHTELKAAPPVVAPTPATEQPISVSPSQNGNEASAQSPANIPLKVEPYSPQKTNN